MHWQQRSTLMKMLQRGPCIMFIPASSGNMLYVWYSGFRKEYAINWSASSCQENKFKKKTTKTHKEKNTTQPKNKFTKPLPKPFYVLKLLLCWVHWLMLKILPFLSIAWYPQSSLAKLPWVTVWWQDLGWSPGYLFQHFFSLFKYLVRGSVRKAAMSLEVHPKAFSAPTWASSLYLEVSMPNAWLPLSRKACFPAFSGDIIFLP